MSQKKICILIWMIGKASILIDSLVLFLYEKSHNPEMILKINEKPRGNENT